MSIGSRRLSRWKRGAVAEFYPYSSARELNAVKREAGQIVQYALRTGSLMKLPCNQCGAARSEAHHDDYAKPLDVIWLCRYHHRHRDADLREARRRAALKAMPPLPVAYLKRQARLQPVPFAAPIARAERTRRRSLVTMDSTIALVVQATTAVADAMDAELMSESQIARQLKVSRQFVNTQFAGGFRTLKVLAAYADALGYDAVFTLRKRQEQEIAS